MRAANHTPKNLDAARKHLDQCQFALTELAESLNALAGIFMAVGEEPLSQEQLRGMAAIFTQQRRVALRARRHAGDAWTMI